MDLYYIPLQILSINRQDFSNLHAFTGRLENSVDPDFVRFYFLRPINNLSVKQGPIFLG